MGGGTEVPIEAGLFLFINFIKKQEISMKRSFSKLLASLVASLAFASAAQASVNIGGTVFEDTAFADSLTSFSGSFTTEGGSLASVLTDKEISTYAFSFDPRASVTLSFTDNLAINGLGNDVALYDLGIPGTFIVTINGITNSYLSTDTEEVVDDFFLTQTFFDLNDFGIASGDSISSLNIRLDSIAGNNPVPSLALVGALNTAPVPEPSSYALMLLGLAGTAAAARRRSKR